MSINNILHLGIGLLFFITVAVAQNNFKICATSKHIDLCTQLQRGNGQVTCQWVQDAIECAARLQNRTADFGAFSTESTVQLGVLDWNGLTVVKELRSNARISAPVDFESVVIVRKDHQGGTAGLRGRKYCHPGLHYGQTEKWTERFLKEMERTVVKPVCENGRSSSEIEVASLSQFFGPSCRPGIWSHDIKEDAVLKKKYSSLCKLCPKSDCKYDNTMTTTGGNDKNHQLALNCLKNDGGEVAYVSRQDAESYFSTEESSKDFQYLCPNDSMQNIYNNTNPCVWLRQPWRTIIVASELSVTLVKAIELWFKTAKANTKREWQHIVVDILEAQDGDVYPCTLQRPVAYINEFRQIPQSDSICNTEISWCTTSRNEYEKCSVVRAGAITTGVQPLISCREPVGSTLQCMEDIFNNKSDFMGIDSNYGYLARKVYNLTAAMFFETEQEQYSSVVVVVHEESNIKSFNDLRDKQVCLPEFGATPSIAFINWGKSLKYFDKKECRHGHILNNFFGDSCAPGAQDWKHFITKSDAPDSLCALCLIEKIRPQSHIGARSGISSSYLNSTSGNQEGNIGSCAANTGNKYFGNRGALRCLNEVGDAAILELQSLQEHADEIGVDASQFRILCRNGSLAQNTGFDVDLDCALTTIVDGEIVIRRGSLKTSSIVNALNALDTYFQAHPDFKMYNIYNQERSLLYKDSTVGLTATNNDNHGATVKNYIELFRDIEICVGNSAIIHQISFSALFSFILLTIVQLLY